MIQLSHPFMTTGKIIALTVRTFVGKVMSWLFNTLSRFVRTFLPRSKCFFNFRAAVIVCSDFGSQENKICHCFHFFTLCLPWGHGTGYHGLSFFWMLSFHPAFSLSSFTFIKKPFNSSSFLPFEWYHLHIWGYWYFSQQSWFQFVSHPAWYFTWCTLHRS